MIVKIDTNEKFHVIQIGEADLSANMTAPLLESLLTFLKTPVKNVVVNGQDIHKLDNAAADAMLAIHERFVAEKASFVIYALRPEVKMLFDRDERYEGMQIVPTLSEASDIVYMEEIEREFDA